MKRDPKSVGASTMIGMLLEAQGKKAEAEKAYEQVLAIDSRAPVAANNLAWIYVASNRNLDQALQLAQTAHQTLPEEPAAEVQATVEPSGDKTRHEAEPFPGGVMSVGVAGNPSGGNFTPDRDADNELKKLRKKSILNEYCSFTN